MVHHSLKEKKKSQGVHEGAVFTVKSYFRKNIKGQIHNFLKRNHIFSINHLSFCIENHLCDQNQMEKLREKKRKLASIP